MICESIWVIPVMTAVIKSTKALKTQVALLAVLTNLFLINPVKYLTLIIAKAAPHA
jgi:hypothetical protein